jgi:hypothetical protein
MKTCMNQAVYSVLVAGTSLSISASAFAYERSEVSSKVLYQAVDQLTEYLNKDMAKLSDVTKKTAIINYTQSEELPTSIQNYLIKRLEHMANSNQKTPVKFVQCIECLSLQAVAEGEEIFIRKGIADDKQLQATLGKLGIKKYSDINLAYTGDQLVMQMNVVDENKLVDWTGEYKTPYKAYDESQWQLGVGAEVGAFQGGGAMPAARGARVIAGQRLTGIGAVGLSVSYFESTPGVPQIVSYGSFFNLSHNEIFNQYWDFVRLSYNAEVGVTDFNGNQLLHETLGVKSVFGKYYSVGLNGKMHQFVAAPKDDTPIANSEGEPVLKNNDVLPTMVSLFLGVEFL